MAVGERSRRCYDCGKLAAGSCPLCGLSFCRLCLEREGENCCNKARDLPIFQVGIREGMERAAVIASELRSAAAEDDRSWIACRHWTVTAILAAAKEIT